ncbi:MAG: class I SAM-dependent methyltransferase [Candidatus Uhrbacteria bacterium]|nr:class I SAM-dependent methyltransferase [Candidatus Uhrbacteria bacterium]MDP3793519.1 class I SAM-dependent methyltransferase [Candidatus Uhrbacteria bacterium]
MHPKSKRYTTSNRHRSTWWRNEFEKNYERIYAPILTKERTAKEVDFLHKVLRLKHGASVLDLACGYGRHALELAKLGYDVFGTDQSPAFIAKAKRQAKRAGVHVTFKQQDMRELSMDHPMSAVIIMFTSFGYFPNDRDHQKVLFRVARVLKSKGYFLLDLPNPYIIRMHLKPHPRRIGGLTLIDIYHPKTKRWSIVWKNRRGKTLIRAGVRIFSLAEITKMLRKTGFEIKKIWGEFDHSAFQKKSRRMIVLTQKIS